jgi:hypothetical protein
MRNRGYDGQFDGGVGDRRDLPGCMRLWCLGFLERYDIDILEFCAKSFHTTQR